MIRRIVTLCAIQAAALVVTLVLMMDPPMVTIAAFPVMLAMAIHRTFALNA